MHVHNLDKTDEVYVTFSTQWGEGVPETVKSLVEKLKAKKIE
jgi:hypothetical protein